MQWDKVTTCLFWWPNRNGCELLTDSWHSSSRWSRAEALSLRTQIAGRSFVLTAAQTSSSSMVSDVIHRIDYEAARFSRLLGTLPMHVSLSTSRFRFVSFYLKSLPKTVKNYIASQQCRYVWVVSELCHDGKNNSVCSRILRLAFKKEMSLLERDCCTLLNALHLIGPGHLLLCWISTENSKLPPAAHKDSSSRYPAHPSTSSRFFQVAAGVGAGDNHFSPFEKISSCCSFPVLFDRWTPKPGKTSNGCEVTNDGESAALPRPIPNTSETPLRCSRVWEHKGALALFSHSSDLIQTTQVWQLSHSSL